MKKIFALLALTLFVAANSNAQDKAVKFGLKVSPGLNIYTPDDEKSLAKDGSILNFAWGGAVEFNLGDNAAIVTGLEVLTTGGKIAFLDSALYGVYDSEMIEVNKDGSISSDTSGFGNQIAYYKLNSRRYKANYVHLPFAIKAKTNEIGYLTYFGQFGINTAINTKGRSDDKSSEIFGNNIELNDMNIDNEVEAVKFVLQVGGGAEYNLSGSTSMVFSIHYNHGFTNVLKGKSKHLVNANGTAAFDQKVFERGATLSIGILF